MSMGFYRIRWNKQGNVKMIFYIRSLKWIPKKNIIFKDSRIVGVKWILKKKMRWTNEGVQLLYSDIDSRLVYFLWGIIWDLTVRIIRKVNTSTFLKDCYEDLRFDQKTIENHLFSIHHIIDQVNATKLYSAFAHNVNVPSLRNYTILWYRKSDIAHQKLKRIWWTFWLYTCCCSDCFDIGWWM